MVTVEQYKIAEANGIPRRYVDERIKRYCWTIKKAITTPVKRKASKELTDKEIRLVKNILTKFKEDMEKKDNFKYSSDIKSILNKI